MADTRRTLSALQTLLADNTSGNISPQDVRDLLVSVYPDMENARNYGATGDGTTDDTVAIQAAIDAVDPGGVCFVPAGVYVISQLQIPQGVSLWGEGIHSEIYNGTKFEQKDGVDVSAIVTSMAGTWHWVELRNFQLRKVAGATDTLGSGIEVDILTGEGFLIERVDASSFPEAGIRFDAAGGTTVTVRDVHVHGNGTYGLDIGRTGGRWQVVICEMISGDKNGTALIRILNFGAPREGIFLNGIKSESDGTDQLYVVELDGVTGPVFINNLGALSTGDAATAVIWIHDGDAQVIGMMVRAFNCGDLIDDDDTVNNISMDTDRNFFMYNSGAGMVFEQNNDSIRSEAFFDIKEMSAPAAPNTDEARLYVVENGGKTELNVRFATGAVQQIAIEP